MRLVVMLVALTVSAWVVAAQPTLSIGAGADSRSYSAAALLGRGDVVSITIPNDVSYRRSMTYRAVPLTALLAASKADQSDTLEARATDGFVAQIPLELVAHAASGGAIAYLAVEDPANPWPALPNEKKSAGPFYLIWDHAERSNVRAEQWPYALVSLGLAESPVHRWPQLALHSADAAAQSGQKVFVTFCLPCHQFNGAGVGKVGPDLGKPMNVTQYITEPGLRALVRNPAGVRTWPEQHMAGFDTKVLPDADLNALVAYLKAMGNVSR